MTVIKFPPRQTCEGCGAKLRPASADEIARGLQDPNPAIRQAFAHAVQGNTDKKFVVDNSFTRRMEHETPPAGWLMMCDACGMKSVHLVEEPE